MEDICLYLTNMLANRQLKIRFDDTILHEIKTDYIWE